MICHPKCTIGQHFRLEEIETAMINMESNRSIAERFAVNREAVRNHRTLHLPKRLRAEADAAEARDPGGEKSLWTKLTEREETLERLCRRAERLKQFSVVISASKELREIAELKGKIRGELAAPSAGGDMTLVVAMDSQAAERALATYAERRGLPSGSPDVIDAEVLKKGDA